ncbi:MAG: PVC-type heme-binding CxxCH protein [Gemmataceae bacterium]
MRRLALLLSLLLPTFAPAGDGNRLAYLDEVNPYYPSRTFPKLITPQWVGEPGVDAVVILAIDDMRGSEKWEQFLRPILNRLKKIDGRAPVSIMTCNIDPHDPQLQKWLKEGLSLEVHTIDHPCPLLQKGDFAKAKSTFDRCVDLMNEIPGNKPVCFRVPCCDSLNTVSPRFFAEIFNKTTAKGHFLQADSSVFHVFTANDPALPRELVLEPDGRERFRKYLPLERSFVNYIEDYPYPYTIGRLCWEFPCMTPSDWQAQHLHKNANPITLRDWKAALDATVIKQGVFSFVFHPYGWSTPEQFVDFIDYAQSKYGKRVKFLTFREAVELLNKNVLGRGGSLRHPKIRDDSPYGVRLLDLDGTRSLGAIVGNPLLQRTRIWDPEGHRWNVTDAPVCYVNTCRFGFVKSRQYPTLMSSGNVFHFDGKNWQRDEEMEKDVERQGLELGGDTTVRFCDLDGDGVSELIVDDGKNNAIFQLSNDTKHWKKLPFGLPPGARLVDADGDDCGLRFIDLDSDGRDDVIFSNEKEYGIYLFTDMEHGWSRKVIAGKAGEPGALPPIAINGKNNGFWAHSGYLWWQNENTDHLKDHVDRRKISDLLVDAEPTAKSPEAALASIQTRPGFQVEQMAAEPQVLDPIAFAFAPDGKLWVVEMGDYPLGVDGKGKFGGKVKFLESTKGDGKYDKATVVLENLGFPTGVLPWRDGILVTCAPEIFFVPVKDGKAGEKQVILTGFVQGNQQHRVNTLAWGLDNWIYVANGDSGGKIVSKKTGKTVDISGRDLRFRPDTGEHEATSGQTQYGRSRDDWGNWFGGNNSNPMYHFVLDEHYQRRNPHVPTPDSRWPVSVQPGVAPVYPVSRTLPRFNDPGAANRFTSACSPIVYRDTFYGPHFDNNTFVSEPVHNLVHREIMKPLGLSFRSERAIDEQKSEFLASTDNWFRPTMISTGPDGCIWVADMYRAVIEHPQWIPKDWQAKLDLRAGHDMGRIYRVVPVGTPPRAIPRLDLLDTAGLVDALDSPSGWQRDMAQMMLLWRNDKVAVPLLKQLVRGSPRPLARLHALCALDGLSALDPKLLQSALSDIHPGVRRHAVRLCEGRLGQSPELAAAFVKLADDADPQVRLQFAYSLGEWPDAPAGPLLAKLALSTDDRYFTAAVLSSVNAANIDAMIAAVMAAPTLPLRLIEPLLATATGLGRKSAVAVMLAALTKPTDSKYELRQMQSLADVLDTLSQRGVAAEKEAVQQLSAVFAFARQRLIDDKAPLPERTVAMRLLGREPEQRTKDFDALSGFLVPQAPDELQAAAVTAFGNLRDDSVPARLLKHWKSYGPARRAQVLQILLRREEGIASVLHGLGEKQIDPSEIDTPSRQRLLNDKSVAFRDRAVKLFAASIDADRQKVIDAYKPVLTMKGDVAHGKELFAKSCSNCHRLNGVGNEVGPDLAALAGRSLDYLLVQVLDPNRAVEARYVNYLLETKTGLSLTGVLLNETSTSVTIVGTDGKPQTILRTNLEALTSTGKSAMPDGLEKDLKHQDMADVLAYVRSSKPATKPKEFAGNRPELLKPVADGSFELRATSAEIYGPTLVYEAKYQNLGFWSSPDDHAAWTLQVSRAGKYEVWAEWACANDAAGNSFILESDVGHIMGKVAGTGTWDTYKYAKIGALDIPAGEQRLTLRPEGRPTGAMLDLKLLRLVPTQ